MIIRYAFFAAGSEARSEAGETDPFIFFCIIKQMPGG